ncbi:SMP-30/gluconolactonase/LRE family protein [Propionimicrobium sp. PCR01-08-3]|uniref:SMP-30/gluconolactonase/LRE family protein n=1 Tax=Propionimicrobium sp. PCR01-08-3 TaxID=3052086 RepID=UPI00255C6359|nr:SMP-30/gluconolactonase/LRE family protein [Propionimicrobium sp. PCR01-08-3]WIY81898.1 SMP-30/gluconolactonase/LRE family protein [Propionimicrobium sp. PCR01-08-3]
MQTDLKRANESRVLVSGLGMLESVRVTPGSVWFSDWTAGRIYRYVLETGTLELQAEVASMPLCFEPVCDEMFVFDATSGLVLRGVAGGRPRAWADVSGLAEGGGNELLVHDERVYVNFGNFDPRKGFPDSAVGLIACIEDDGSARVVADSLAFPNGMALSSDGSELVVAESHAGRLSAWRIAEDGSLTDRRVWANIEGAAPDGISMAPDGTCWFADVPARAVVRVAEGGEILERITLDRGAFSCAYASGDNMLYVVAAHWPGGARLFDSSHQWDGQLIAVPVGT